MGRKDDGNKNKIEKEKQVDRREQIRRGEKRIIERKKKKRVLKC